MNATETAELATMTPEAVDTILAEIYGRMSAVYAERDRLTSRDYRGERRGTDEQLRANAGRLAELDIEAEPYNAEYNARRWTRVFLVTGGHAHRSMACHTCYSTTRFCWLPEWSGKTEADIVDAAGDRACTACYPSAPVDPRPSRLSTPAERATAAEREAAAVAKAERDAVKAAKGITYQGGELRGEWGIIKTERAAWIELVDNMFCTQAYGYTARDETNARIVEALAEKAGATPEAIRDVAAGKVAAKAKREARR